MNNDIRSFFDNHVQPLSQANGKAPALDTAFRTGAESYFSAPMRPDCLYLNTIPTGNEAALETYLLHFWKDEPALQAMVPDLVRLAFKLKAVGSEQTADLSPFVYAMF